MPQYAYFVLIFKNSFSHWLKFIFIFLFSQTTLYICSYMHLLRKKKKKSFLSPWIFKDKQTNKDGVLRCPFLFLFCYFIGFTHLKFSQWQNNCGDLKTVNQKWHDAAYTSRNAERRVWLWLLFTSKCTNTWTLHNNSYLLQNASPSTFPLNKSDGPMTQNCLSQEKMQKGQVFVEESKPIWAHPAGAYDFLSGEQLGEHLRPLVSGAFIYHELLKNK